MKVSEIQDRYTSTPAELSTGEMLAMVTGKFLPLLAEPITYLLEFSVKAFTENGFTKNQAIRLKACLDLLKEDALNKHKSNTIIRSSLDIYEHLKGVYNVCEPVEHFYMLYLNRRNEVIGKDLISTGSTSGTLVDVKVLLKKAIINGASSVIVSHNHPSGSIRPSTADYQITIKIKKAFEIADINVLDHIIFADHNDGYYSFADNAEM